MYCFCPWLSLNRQRQITHHIKSNGRFASSISKHKENQLPWNKKNSSSGSCNHFVKRSVVSSVCGRANGRRLTDEINETVRAEIIYLACCSSVLGSLWWTIKMQTLHVYNDI